MNAYAGASKWAFRSIYDQPPMVGKRLTIPTYSSAAFFLLGLSGLQKSKKFPGGSGEAVEKIKRANA